MLTQGDNLLVKPGFEAVQQVCFWYLAATDRLMPYPSSNSLIFNERI